MNTAKGSTWPWLLMVFLLPMSMSHVAYGSSETDPWEKMNRGIFAFNDTVDHFILKPAALTYQKITPGFVDRSVTNFFYNLDDVIVVLNDLLQLKLKQAGQDSARFVINSTLGLAGTLDIATKVGLEKHEEDFGQTLGFWGVPSGPYLVLPILGPCDLRDTFGWVPDYFTDPVYYYPDESVRHSLTALDIVDTRADLFMVEQLISGDRYVFLRDAYLQRREFLVNDGQVEDDFLEDDFDDFEFE